MADQITFAESYIYSKDIIARHDELKSLYDDLIEEYDAADLNSDDGDVIGMLSCFDTAEEYVKDCMDTGFQEMTDLYIVRDKCECSTDWFYGDQLIKESEFPDYAKQIAEKVIDSNFNKWPMTCIDWSDAATQLEKDYMLIEAPGGNNYFIRGPLRNNQVQRLLKFSNNGDTDGDI